MTSIERENIEALARKAKTIREIWQREREEALAAETSANSEIRRGWREFDNPDEANSAKMSGGFRQGR